MDDELIRHWKKEHGRIFSAEMRGITYIFRSITLEEFSNLRLIGGELTSAEQEDALVEIALLHPSGVEMNKIPAGVFSTLAEEIIRISGFGDPKFIRQVMDEERLASSQYHNLMKAFIITSMPSYTEEDLDKLTFYELAHKVTLAEQILQIQQAVMSGQLTHLNPVDPEEEAAEAAKQAAIHAAAKKPGQAGYNDPIAQKLRAAL